jgi:hypothetical protein
MPGVRRIAMWSGPRNISTAMMRSWGSRPDTIVCDEPLYAHYLRTTRLAHPGADEVLGSQENDWRKVVAWLTEHEEPGKSVFYQKHMAHHLLPSIERGWLGKVTNAILIREPREVVASFLKVVPNPRIEDTGFPQQVEIFEFVWQTTGRVPPVIDARDVLTDPERALRLLCAALELEFAPAMLSWPAGPRATDGVWAKHWYDAVLRSTRFEPYRARDVSIPKELDGLVDEARRLYARLHEHRLGG